MTDARTLDQLVVGDTVTLIPDGGYQQRLLGTVARVTKTTLLVECPSLRGSPRRFFLETGRPFEKRYSQDFPCYQLRAGDCTQKK